MGKREKRKPGAPYRGFRFGIAPKRMLHMKAWEKCEVLTDLQHAIVQEYLDRCTKEIKDDKGTVIEININGSPYYIARLVNLLDKPFNEAKVDAKGNSWEKPKPLTDEEIKKMNKKTIEDKNRKGKSRKDLKKEKDVKKNDSN